MERASQRALGDYYNGKLSNVRMGDTPSISYMSNNDLEDPSKPGSCYLWHAAGNGFEPLGRRRVLHQHFDVMSLLRQAGVDD